MSAPEIERLKHLLELVKTSDHAPIQHEIIYAFEDLINAHRQLDRASVAYEKACGDMQLYERINELQRQLANANEEIEQLHEQIYELETTIQEAQ